MYSLDDLGLPEVPLTVQPEVLCILRQRTFTLCQSLGMIRADRMSPDKFAAGRFELLTALAYPAADLDALAVCNDFLTYLFYVDDQAEEDERFGKDPVHLRRYFETHVQALREGAEVDPSDGAGQLLLNLRYRLLQLAPQSWLARFADNTHDYLLRGTLVGAQHWTAGTVPRLAEFAAQRAYDSAVFCTQDLIEVACSGVVPSTLVHSREFDSLRRLCTNVVAFTNDLVSYQKEVVQYGSPNNLVHVVAVQERLSLPQAIKRVIEIVNGDVRAFEAVATRLEAQLGENTWTILQRYTNAQRSWMSGNLAWSLATGRYISPQSPIIELRPRVPPKSSQAVWGADSTTRYRGRQRP